MIFSQECNILLQLLRFGLFYGFVFMSKQVPGCAKVDGS